jgi:hypothetical protein
MSTMPGDLQPKAPKLAYATPHAHDQSRLLANVALTMAISPAVVAFAYASVTAIMRQDLWRNGVTACILAWPLTAVVALGLAIAAQRQGARGAKGENARLAIGLGICSLLLWAGIVLMPSSGDHTQTRARMKSASNLHQIGGAILLYANDHQGAYPPDFQTLLLDGNLTPDVFISPSSKDTPSPGATLAQQAANLTSVPGHCSYTCRIPPGATQSIASDMILANENLIPGVRRYNFLYADGGVNAIDPPQAKWVVSQLDAGHNPPGPMPAGATK